MKAKHVIIYLLLVIVTSSCIRDEAPNAEADILSCRLPGITMTASPIINNNSVTLFVTPGTNISALAPGIYTYFGSYDHTRQWYRTQFQFAAGISSDSR